MEAKIDLLLKDINIQGLKSLVDELCSEAYPVNDSKPILLYLANKMAEIDSNTCTEISTHAINTIKSRQSTFNEAVSLFILVNLLF